MIDYFTVKCFAAVTFIAAGAVGGNYQARRLSRRENMIEELIGGIRLFRSEIYYTHDRLSAVSGRLADSCSGCASRLFQTFCEELSEDSGSDAAQIWQGAVTKTFKGDNALSQKDRNVLAAAGSRLGRDDIEGQRRHLEKTEEELKVRLEEARRDKESKTSLYKTLGTAAGAAAAVLIF